jgi:hypothetical protein
VEIRRGELVMLTQDVAQAFDRENNLYTFYAERNYLVTWDTALQAAVLIDRGT